LRQHGFRTAEPMSSGSGGRADGLRELPAAAGDSGRLPADEYLLKCLASDAATTLALLHRIGELAGRFLVRFIHKDLYLKHVFVADRELGCSC